MKITVISSHQWLKTASTPNHPPGGVVTRELNSTSRNPRTESEMATRSPRQNLRRSISLLRSSAKQQPYIVKPSVQISHRPLKKHARFQSAQHNTHLNSSQWIWNNSLAKPSRHPSTDPPPPLFLPLSPLDSSSLSRF